MNSSDQIRIFLSSLLYQLPVLLICVTGTIIVMLRWKQISPASMWAFLGFGLATAVCIIGSAAQAAVQAWVMQHQESNAIAQRSWMFSSLSLFWSLLRAVSYGLLLIAVFIGRNKNAT